MSPIEIVGLIGSAAAAGLINAVAGGGTLVTFPTLLLFGVDSKVANATSSTALFLGTAGGVAGYRRQLAAVKPWLVRFVPVSILGAAAGSWLLTHTPSEAFNRIVPFLLLFATVLFLSQGVLRRMVGPREGPPGPAAVWGSIAFQLGVAVYGGYFGAGIGILMLASLGVIGLTDIHEMNALKTVLASLINFVATIVFAVDRLIDWPRAGVMTAGALLGYYVGSHFAQRIPQARVRQMVTAVGFVLSAYTFYKTFLR
jgi:uncharacterized membrane protein YfcA